MRLGSQHLAMRMYTMRVANKLALCLSSKGGFLFCGASVENKMRRVLPNTRNIVNVASAPVEFTLQAHRGADEEDYDEEVDKGPNVKNAYIWRTDEIVKYLQSQTWSHPNLISAVKQHRIDGMGFLRLEKVDLEEFGIEQSIDRNRILINIYKIAPDTIRVKPVLSRVER